MEHLNDIPVGTSSPEPEDFWTTRAEKKLAWARENLNEEALARKISEVEQEIEKEKVCVNRFLNQFLAPFLKDKNCTSWSFSYEVYGPDVDLNDMEEETRKIALQMLKHSFSNKGWSVSEGSSVRTVRDFMEGECRVCTATVAFRKN